MQGLKRLPPHVQEEYRREEEKRIDRRLARRRATEARYLVEGVMLFALLEFLFFGLSPGRLLVLAVPGLALGWTCSRLRAGEFTYAVAAAVAYAAGRTSTSAGATSSR